MVIFRYFTEISWGFWEVLCEMSPYLLFGFLVAGILSVFISRNIIERHLGESKKGSVIKASLLGAPLPLCSCGVIPVAASLRKHGAGKGATTSFLLSTPQTGVDSILVTLSLLGPVFAVFRPIAALATGILGGGLVSLLDPENGKSGKTTPSCEDDCCNDEIKDGKFLRAIRFGFLTLPLDIGRALLIGIFIAGLISVLIPEDFFTGMIQNNFLSMLVMMVIGIPIYVCATASVPVAAALILKGISPGAALVFLLTGPATNAATITMVWKMLGKRSTIIYLMIVCASALLCGLFIDGFFPESAIPVIQVHDHQELGVIKQLAAVVLLGVLGFAWYWSSRGPKKNTLNTSEQMIRLQITGMTCSGCVDSVRRTLQAVQNVSTADVYLKPGLAVITGNNIPTDDLLQRIKKAGFDASVQRD